MQKHTKSKETREQLRGLIRLARQSMASANHQENDVENMSPPPQKRRRSC